MPAARAIAASQTIPNLGEALRWLEQSFDDAGIESSALDARLILCHLLSLPPVRLVTERHRQLSESEWQGLEQLATRRIAREPMAYMMGEREFWGRSFRLNADTLVPRPDSETMIEVILSHYPEKSAPLTWMDMGTGSGCLLLTLLAEYPHSTGFGVDKAAGAIHATAENARNIGVSERVMLHHGDWCNMPPIPKVDVLVSNPPYIPTHDLAALMPDVRDYEPSLALDGGADGLSCYRTLFQQARSWLRDGGRFYLEIGHSQGEAVTAIAKASGFHYLTSHADLAGVERVLAFA